MIPSMSEALRPRRPGLPDAQRRRPRDWIGGGDHTDMADRGAHREGLPDRPLSELPGALMNMASIAGGGIPAVLGAGSHMTTGKGLMGNIADLMGWGGNSMAGVPGIGISNGQQTMVSPELQGMSDPSQVGGGFGVDLDAAGSVGESPGLYAGGGVVDEALIPGDPPGPDDVIIAAKRGELVLNERQQAALAAALRGRR